jgi:hypothetical protein
MIDFAAVQRKEKTLAEICRGLTAADLRDLTNEMIDRQLGLIDGCRDEDVVFEPDDPLAHDAYALDPEEEDLAWNLGHLIVHVTASSEESAFLAAEMARGVPYENRRSRAEVHWTTMKTIEGCRQRLEESRRMRHASLDMWPDAPHLDNSYISPYNGQTVNPIMRFVLGLQHDHGHLAQIEEVVRQAKAARA